MQRELEKSLGDSGLGPSAMTDVSDFYSPAFIAASQLGSFVIGCIAGLVLSLIISAVMKKDPPRLA